ncbi:asparaginase [Helicobacter colisuis]
MSLKTYKPNIMILATGGTIAGEAKNKLRTTDYKSGSLSVELLIEAIPQLQCIVNIQTKQIANIDSADMTDLIWLKLAKTINVLLKDSEIDGIVITHGTDTMEETAYFLSLVIKSDKPVVLTGAMRPATAMSADGPRNLYNAISLAGNKNAEAKGVMIVMNDRIHSAREATKMHTLNVESFQSPNGGEMGYIIDGKVFFKTINLKLHTLQTPFNIERLDSLPKVDIVYSYANDGSRVAIEAFLKAGAKGLVIAGSGAGSIHKNQKEYLIELLKENKLQVVKSSRVGCGMVLLSEEENTQGFVSANDLNPQKARILLMLSLTQTNNPRKIAEYFEKF